MAGSQEYYALEEMPDDEKSPIMSATKENGGPRSDSIFVTKVQPCLAEFLGTTLFIFIGTMSVRTDNVVAPALAHGFALFALVASFGRVSGGHFNPAVTLGITISGGVSLLLAPMYVGCQLIGGLLGALMTRGCLSYFPPVVAGQPNVTIYAKISGGAQTLVPGIPYGSALLTEMMLTFLLVLVILMVAVDSDAKGFLAPLAIGATLTGAIFAGGASTGASLNPARTFGPAVAVSDINPDVWANHWIYWVGPLLGGTLAGGLFRFLLASPDKRVLFKED